ncbi:hypothetical protein X745_20855 [Mesorhizobium sp. LNJC374B00]|nr:hypothetical protein X745_20855 [Mesorhizobium sp. LNJC374B00]
MAGFRIRQLTFQPSGSSTLSTSAATRITEASVPSQHRERTSRNIMFSPPHLPPGLGMSTKKQLGRDTAEAAKTLWANS